MNMTKEGISIIICCYNSAARISPTLEHLARQKDTENINWEIILVDNNSKDHTASFAQKIWDKQQSDIPFRILTEKKQGHNFAKLCGISHAQYNLLLLCDDDNWLDENYINIGFNFMKDNPKTALLGGKGDVVFEEGFSAPDWFWQAAKIHYAIHEPAKEKDGIQADHVYGAGSIIRKRIFKTLQEKKYDLILTGRTKKSVKSGDDIEIGFITKILGHHVIFLKELKFKHFLSKDRIHPSWIKPKIMDVDSPFVVGAYIDYYNNNYKSYFNYHCNLINKLIRILLIAIKKTFLFQWNFYSQLWFRSQIKSIHYQLFNYKTYQNTMKYIQKLEE
jgi:glycosyltransferase involved in cell wall biosynthesis